MTDPVSFYTDAHIPITVVRQLREAGARVVRCQEVGLTTAADVEHFDYAVENELMIITCDFDFAELHWMVTIPHSFPRHYGILYCRQGEKCDVSTIVNNALLIFRESSKEEMAEVLWRA